MDELSGNTDISTRSKREYYFLQYLFSNCRLLAYHRRKTHKLQVILPNNSSCQVRAVKLRLNALYGREDNIIMF